MDHRPEYDAPTAEDLQQQKVFFPKTFYSNIELLKTNRWRLSTILLLFLVNVSLISAPFFMARAGTKPATVYSYMPNLEPALSALYDLQLECRIESASFVCDQPYDAVLTAGDYQIYITPDQDTVIADSSRFVFGETAAAFYYVAADDRDDYTLTGTYRLLEGMDFAAIDREALGFEDMTEAEFTAYINETVVGALLSADLVDVMATIYLTQLVQTTLYVLFMSFMLLAANLRRQQKKIRYGSSLRYVVVGITGPALLACIVGLFSTFAGTIVWSAAYAVRMIVFYMKINNLKGTF